MQKDSNASFADHNLLASILQRKASVDWWGIQNGVKMQDRYAGDVGDFVKLGLLRAIAPGHQLGLAWYRFPDEAHNKDGRHIDYLQKPDTYKALDPELFDHLGKVVLSARKLATLLPVLPGAISFEESLEVTGVPARKRRDWRQSWFSRVIQKLKGCDLVFADPDNGIVDDKDTRKGRATFGKQIPLSEVRDLARGRCAVIYHHNTRRPGGHDEEVNHWINQFGMPAIAIRATAYSPRTFFVINPSPEIEHRAEAFCASWRTMKVRLHVTTS
ncbi:hypothetical protein [Labrenzia sp. 011]|uniref:hypothetical protein n=1 Tax=Labrenzia sp. 011 TaxID=2171494 RepID=UPI0010574C89|nr:hypothetical protein [Labrenzia sp. 011]